MCACTTAPRPPLRRLPVLVRSCRARGRRATFARAGRTRGGGPAGTKQARRVVLPCRRVSTRAEAKKRRDDDRTGGRRRAFYYYYYYYYCYQQVLSRCPSGSRPLVFGRRRRRLEVGRVRSPSRIAGEAPGRERSRVPPPPPRWIKLLRTKATTPKRRRAVLLQQVRGFAVPRSAEEVLQASSG